MNYSNLQWRDREVVERWLQWKLLTNMEHYDPNKYDEYCDEYLDDSMKDRYIIRTRGHITASKLKCYIANPEEYYYRYVLELPECIDKEWKHFTMGNAYELLVSEWMEWFEKKYYIDKGYLKADLARLIANGDSDLEKVLVKKTLEELRISYYKPDDKIRLTPAEWRDIIGMYYETRKQSIFEMWSEDYKNQVYFEWKFLDLTISGTLDRYGKEVRKIRDFKTSGQFDKFEEQMMYEYDYITSMAFYYGLAYIVDEVECDVYLDVQESKAPYRSEVFKLSASRLKEKLQNYIRPWLVSLNESHKNNQRAIATREEAVKSPYYPIMEASIIYEAKNS